MNALRLIAGFAAAALAACSAPAPAPSPAPATPVAPPRPAAAPDVPAAPGNPLKLAPRDPSMEAWKRSAAERIHDANRSKLYAGRPHHLLQAVIVVEATVDGRGNVVSSKIMRSPKIKPLDDMALASLKAASPLPPPPAKLLVRGNLVYTETWLVQNDGKFQIRTLSLTQE